MTASQQRSMNQYWLPVFQALSIPEEGGLQSSLNHFKALASSATCDSCGSEAEVDMDLLGPISQCCQAGVMVEDETGMCHILNEGA